jgi:hypothetical protein
MVSPHFPPDTSAGTHRVRLLAPHLPEHGWEPTVLTVDPRDYESRLDEGLAGMVSPNLRVIRCRAISPRCTRRFGVGDLGLRAYRGLRKSCIELLSQEPFDALFITIYPSYPAMLGAPLKKRFNIPFVLDYQDPWVGSWGLSVGGGRAGRADLKSRVTRQLAAWMEPYAVRAADAVTAVSVGTYEEIEKRNHSLRDKPRRDIPLGGEAADFDYLRSHPRENPYFRPDDGNVHLCYVGTLLPLGFETLRAVLHAAKLLRQRRAELYSRLRLRFFGTSNQTDPAAPPRVMPVANELGVSDCVTEVAPRIDYLDALTVQTQATAILMMGSTEHHYTASKLYPGLLAKRPLLVIYHEASTVVDIVRQSVGSPTARMVTYSDEQPAESKVEEIYRELAALSESPVYDPAAVNLQTMAQFSARVLAGRLCEVLEKVRKH